MAELSDTKRKRLIPWFVATVAAAAALVALFSSPAAIAHEPALFAVLAAFVLVLNIVEIDLFGRGKITPASIPAVAIAALFGPVGAAAAAALDSALDVIKGKARIKILFDFGGLALAGSAAALVFALIPAEAAVAILGEVALAGLAFSAVNQLLILVVWYLDEGISPTAAFMERLAWMWPYHAACGVLAGLLVLAERELGLFALALFAVPLLLIWLGEKNQIDHSRRIVEGLQYTNHELENTNRRLTEALGQNELLLSQTHRAYLSTITSLARTIEAKDPYTGGHTERVADIAVALAQEVGFEGDDLRAVQVGAIIHDIGKIGIPDAILLKPGKLDDQEYAEMRRHPEISSYILDELDLPPIVKEMARHHHERYDGRGYPDRLAGEDIPLAARILSVADAYDAMTSDRPYRKALSEEMAMRELQTGVGSQFCPLVTAALMRCLERGAAVAEQDPFAGFALPPDAAAASI